MSTWWTGSQTSPAKVGGGASLAGLQASNIPFVLSALLETGLHLGHDEMLRKETRESNTPVLRTHCSLSLKGGCSPRCGGHVFMGKASPPGQVCTIL